MRTDPSETSIMLYLISCALHDEKPDENILDGVNLNHLFILSKKHSLSAIVYMALQNTEVFHHADQTTVKQWKELKEKAIRKNIMLDAERQQILAELEKKYIWYMPLKGSVLKQLYPHEGMREMADNDILYDATFQKEVREVFKARGYKVISYAQRSHDVYEKEPLYNFEMHTALFAENLYPEFSDMFDNNSDILIKDESCVYGRHLSHENFYVYITAHSYKHYNNAGTGLRTLVDFYVMNEAFNETVDWEYISKQLKQLKIDDYELNCRNLAGHLFKRADLIDESELSHEEQVLLSELSKSGTYGTQEKYITNALKKFSDDGNIDAKDKARYFLQRLFPSREWCRLNSPLCYKYPVMLPYLWLYRIIRAALFRRKKICSEIKMTIRCSTKEKK